MQNVHVFAPRGDAPGAFVVADHINPVVEIVTVVALEIAEPTRITFQIPTRASV